MLQPDHDLLRETRWVIIFPGFKRGHQRYVEDCHGPQMMFDCKRVWHPTPASSSGQKESLPTRRATIVSHGCDRTRRHKVRHESSICIKRVKVSSQSRHSELRECLDSRLIPMTLFLASPNLLHSDHFFWSLYTPGLPTSRDRPRMSRRKSLVEATVNTDSKQTATRKTPAPYLHRRL